MGNIRSGLDFQQVLLLGLSKSGKSLFLKRLIELKRKELENCEIKSTLDYNYVNIVYNAASFDVWDLSGDSLFRMYWSTFYRNIVINLVIYFIDIYDEENFSNTIKEFLILTNEEELKSAKFLILFNVNTTSEHYNQNTKLDVNIENLKIIIKNSTINDFESRVQFFKFDISKMRESETKTVDLLSKCLRNEKNK